MESLVVTPTPLFHLFVLLVGAAFGSFFTVVVYRVPLGMSIVRPPSHCPECKNRLKWHDNLPMVGWLLLRGKCRFCKKPIPVRYPLIEFGCGLALAAAAWCGMPPGQGADVVAVERTARLMLLTVLAFPVVVTDLRSMLIPDVAVIPGIALALLVSLLPGGLEWRSALGGAVVVAVALWAFGRLMSKILGRDAMGFGDVKLVAFFGALMGAKFALMAVLVGAFFGAAVSLPLAKLRKGEIPFGPFLYLGAFVVWFQGERLWNLYLAYATGG